MLSGTIPDEIDIFTNKLIGVLRATVKDFNNLVFILSCPALFFGFNKPIISHTSSL